MKKLNKKGFTLVELIVVIVIIAILAAALVTSLVGYITKAQDTTALTEANNVYTAAQAYISEKSVTAYEADGAKANAETISAVNVYLGATVIADPAVKNTSGSITNIDTDNSTIVAFTYTAKNGSIVNYATATGWVVTH